MEVIKTTPNLEFDVIYADGVRKRVREGVLFEAETDGSILFHNGSDRPAVLLAATETALVALSRRGPGLLALAVGMAISEESCAALRELSSWADEIFGDRSAYDKAAFRLGQMDMQQSVVQMLMDLSGESQTITVGATYLAAAERVAELSVSGSDTGGGNDGKLGD